MSNNYCLFINKGFNQLVTVRSEVQDNYFITMVSEKKKLISTLKKQF